MSTGATSEAVYRLLAKLEKQRQSGAGWTARCPAHEDREASLSVSQGDDGRALVRCFAGCTAEAIVAALGLTLADLFVKSEGRPKGRKGSKESAPDGEGQTEPAAEGLTVAEYAEAKGLPLQFLRDLGLRDMLYITAPAVRIPYRLEAGEDGAIRFRLSLDGAGQRFAWKSNTKPIPYGLWRLDEARAAGSIVIVEGESDAQTLWLHGIPAIGLPGADSWKEEWSALLDGIPTIIVVVEPDKGGESVMRWLGKSTLRSRARVVLMQPGPTKDPNGLYLADPGGFPASWQAAVEAAVPWQTIEAAARDERRRAHWKVCAQLAREPHLLDRFVDDLQRSGVIGEARTAKIVYLATVSRMFGRPVSLAVKGPSSAGKSWVVERTLAFFPPSAYHALTAMSEKSLAYSEEPLSHRMLVLYEAAGMSGDFASYLIRSLLSEGRLRYETVEKSHGGIKARVIEREGPTGLVITTTAIHLHPENETRMMTIPVTDSTDQTKNVLLALADERRELPDLTQWHALQSWIEAGGAEVTVPFARVLASLIPPVATRLRRDFSAVLALIRAHALLHQAGRERDGHGAIIATLHDYAAVADLVADLVAEGVQASVPATVRETVGVVAALLGRPGVIGVSLAEVARELRVDKAAASRRVKDAEFRGYVKNLEDKRGRPARLVLAEPLPGDQAILPSVEALIAYQQGYETPSPSSEDAGGGGGFDTPDDLRSTRQRSDDEECLCPAGLHPMPAYRTSCWLCEAEVGVEP